MAVGKRLTALEMPDDDLLVTPAQSHAAMTPPTRGARPYNTPSSIPLPPIPPAPRREVMIQLSIKAPLALVDRLEVMIKATGAQKQAVTAAALDAYLRGHGY